jgi:hypothetical protein
MPVFYFLSLQDKNNTMESGPANQTSRFKYHIDREDGILVVDVSKKVDIIAVTEHYKVLETTLEYPQSLKVLLRAGDSEFRFRENALPLFTVAAEAAMEKYRSVREAIVVSRPMETAVATLFSEISIRHFEFRVFTTETAAREWLLE